MRWLSIPLMILLIFVGACGVHENQNTAMDTTETPLLIPSPTPTLDHSTPDIPLSEALEQMGDHVFLHTLNGTSLWVTDIDNGQQVRIPFPNCTDLFSLVARWSPDGRFISLACPITERKATLAILNVQSDVLEEITQGRAISSVWSPSGSRLLVNVQPDHEHVSHAFVVDAETGKALDLLVGAFWPLPPYGADKPTADPGQLVVVADASMVWSPDATRVALNSNDGLYVINADGTNPHLLEQASDPHLYEDSNWSDGGGFIGPLIWSQDQWILLARARSSKQPNHPTSSIDRMPIRVNADTGEVEIRDRAPLNQSWSPDGAWYVGQAPGTFTWNLYHVDGTLAHTLPYDIDPHVIWMPDSQQFIATRIYVNGEHLFSAITAFDLDGNEHEILPASNEQDVAFSWEPNVSSLSPDGMFLAFENFENSAGWEVIDLQGQCHAACPSESSLFLGWRPRLVPGGSEPPRP